MLNYTRAGVGEPLVLIHGTAGRLQVWDPIIPALTPYFDVIAVDLPGCGRSAMTGDSGVAGLAEAVAELMTELGIEQAHIAGNSAGGSIALELGARGRAVSVTAFSPAGFWSWPGSLWLQVSMRGIHALGTALRPAMPSLLRNVVTRTVLFGFFVGRPWKLDPGVALDDATGVLDSAGMFSLLESLRRYRNPDVPRAVAITVAWGSRDRLLAYGPQHHRARTALPGATHITLPGCGHIPFYDDSDQCAEVILAQRVTKADQ
ncbi:alpha/beta fold hydrolase [Nocardia sp. NPDC057663]|uniref:alpha/beta fold hydrolase n=1 Tax=Nocardia sp. NPDC057663 TaxID=3346201 RepID=UPI0036733A13